DREVAFVTGCGFDVVPSDCLANHVAAQVENPAALVLAIDAPAQMSPGTAKTMVNFLAGGGMVRREGRLEAQPFGAVVQRFCFPHGEKLAASVPWGDLESAYRSTGIPNITTFLALPRPLARLARYATPALKTLLQHAGTRRWMQHTMGRLYSGPSEHARQTARCAIYAWAENRHGQSAEAWLTTVEAYHFTALAGIRCVERVLADHPRGVLTPAQAFGADFVLEIDGTARQDSPHG
ncbi:MAG: saccharopine dehydrogenase, partial [Anaerolineae bacterium]|nr:saccharopine dehydrogenase [Anaerolineae bacterium]